MATPRACIAVSLSLLGACSDPSSPASDAGPTPEDAGSDGRAHDASSARDASTESCEGEALPPRPGATAGIAVHWFSLPSSHRPTTPLRVLARGDALYVPTSPEPVRIDVRAATRCTLGGAAVGTRPNIEDLLPIPGGSEIVAVISDDADPDYRGVLRYSADDGATWETAESAVADPGALGSVVPSAFAPHPTDRSTVFATYPGSHLLVSRDRGATWSIAIMGSGAAPVSLLTSDRAGENLWQVVEGALDRVASYRYRLEGSPPAWEVDLHPLLEANGVYAAAADPHSDHGLYLGAEGTLAYLSLDAADEPVVELRWQTAASDPYTYATAVWADPARAERVLFGGMAQGGGPADLYESTMGGRAPTRVTFDPPISGRVTAIVPTPDADALVVFVDAGTVEVYVTSM